jgi:hypothetical protein
LPHVLPSEAVVRVPPPPRLDPDAAPERWAALLALWFQAVLAQKYPGTVCWPLRKGPVARTKFYKPLVEFARACIARGVRPASWILWSFDAWKHVGKPGAPPPLEWVFSVKRFADREGWFDSEAHQFETVGTIYPSGLRAFDAARWKAIAAAQRGDFIEAKTHAAYARRIAEDSVREADARRADVMARYENGGWLWA